MRPLSASDALSPAFDRTRLVLFSPFRPGRSWKLAATGYLTFGGILFLPVPLCYLAPLGFIRPLGHGLVVAIVTAAILLTLLFTYLFHLCSRLGFAFFDIVLNRREFVAPAWRLYGPQSRRWTLCKLLYGCVATLALALPVVSYIRHLVPIFAAMARTPNQPPDPQMIFALFSGYFVVLGGFLVFGVISALANDFIVPSLALEDTSLGEAFNRLVKLIRYEPAQFALYALLKVVAFVVGYMAVNLATQIVLLVAVAVIGFVGGAIGLILHVAGVSWAVLGIVAAAVGIPIFTALAIYLMFLGAGTMATFQQAYLLYFLGGRYPMLGDLLDRSTPPPVWPGVPSPAGPPAFGVPPRPPQTL